MADKNRITRRQFFQDTAIVVGAGAAATGVLGSFTPTPAEAAPIPKKWDKEADVIVVGSGPTGLAAAIAAVEKGASVTVLEQSHEVGGLRGYRGRHPSIWKAAQEYRSSITYQIHPISCSKNCLIIRTVTTREMTRRCFVPGVMPAPAPWIGWSNGAYGLWIFSPRQEARMPSTGRYITISLQTRRDPAPPPSNRPRG